MQVELYIFGRIGSGDIWNKNPKRIENLHQKYDVICEDMECIAVYQTANLYQIPVISIKGISNNEVLGEAYDERTSHKLQAFVEEVVQIL